jgi:hypothetical protein
MKPLVIVAHIVVLLVIVVIGAGPWVLVAAAGTVASANGCDLDEGSIHPCIINGKDYGEDLYTMGMMGWIGIATCPVALLLLGAYLVINLIVWLVRRNKATAKA